MTEPSRDRIAFQGAPGAFSFEACRACVPGAEPVPCETFADAFAAVASGDCARAFIPIENSTAGRVPEVQALIEAHRLKVESEHLWRVRLQLMALPGVRLEDVRVIASHPMALAQCGRLLDALGVVRVPAYDTAGAAADLARSGDRTRAVVAARAAAELYGLTILRADVEDRPDNTTRFAVLAPSP